MTDAREEGLRNLAAGIRAGIYCRLSVARYGDTTKVEDQERISRLQVGRLGWQLAEGLGYPLQNGVYVDNSKSAWQRNRKRPGWDAMLADVGAGLLDAIVVYHGDRLVRQPWDLEQLLNLAETRGIKLGSPTGVRNLDDSQDKIMLRVVTAFACGSSDDTSRRKKDAYERMRRQGITRPGGKGGRALGFETDGVTHVPAEVAVLREAAARVLAGESCGSVARDLTARGIRSTAGKPLTHQAITRGLLLPRYAGLMPDGESRAAWEPVLERSDWEALHGLIAAKKAGLAPATNVRKYLLSGIARCGACGHPVRVLQSSSAGRRGRPAQTGYACAEDGCRKTYRSVALLDAYVMSRVVARLAKEENPAGNVPESPGLAAEFRALAEQRAEIEAAIRDHTAGRVTLLLARLDSLDARLAELRQLTGESASARLRHDHAGVTEDELGALPLAVRRSLVTACLDVVVLPASRRGPGLRLEDLRITPR